MICSHSLDSVIRGSSDLHQSKVYLSSGLLEIVTQTDHIPSLMIKIALKITMPGLGKPIHSRGLINLKTSLTRTCRVAVVF